MQPNNFELANGNDLPPSFAGSRKAGDNSAPEVRSEPKARGALGEAGARVLKTLKRIHAEAPADVNEDSGNRKASNIELVFGAGQLMTYT